MQNKNNIKTNNVYFGHPDDGTSFETEKSCEVNQSGKN